MLSKLILRPEELNSNNQKNYVLVLEKNYVKSDIKPAEHFF